MGYKINGLIDVSLNYSHQYDCFAISNSIPMPYFSDYTTLIKGNGNLDFTTMNNLGGKFEYSNPNAGLFVNASGSYLRIGDVPIFGYTYENNVYTMQKTGMKSDNKQLFGSVEASKAFGYGKFTITIGADGSQYHYNTLIAEEKNRCRMDNLSAHLRFSFMPSTMFSVEASSVYYNSKSVNKTTPSLTTDALSNFKHSVTMFFMPGNWQLSWTNELNHGNDESVSTAYFSDAKCTYSQKTYEISIGVNNIFGTRKYEREMVSSSYMRYSYNTLRPREVMCKITFSI